MYFKAAVLEKKDKVTIYNLIKPTDLRIGQILVKIYYSSICHTQLQEVEMKRGKDLYLPHCLGHEGVGVVKKTYKGCKKFKPGNKVCISWVKSGKTISSGYVYSDKNGKKINSGPAHTLNEFVVVDESRVYKLKKSSKFRNQVLLGCGKGFMLYDFYLLNPKYYLAGIDISKYAIENSKQEVSQFLSVGSCDDLPFDDNSFDLVISINTIHNLDLEGCSKSLKEISRVSRKNKFIIVDAYRNETEKKKMYAWNLTAKTIMHAKDWVKFFNENNYDGEYYWFNP